MFKINKYEAAIRQLDYAIEAHFAENDIVCVATLTGASLELFRGLAAYNKKRGPWDNETGVRVHFRKVGQ